MENNPFTPPAAPLAEPPETAAAKRGRLIRNALILAVPIALAILMVIPLYSSDYTPRARVSGGILAAAGIKRQIDERLQSGTPPEKAGAGLSVPRDNIVKGGTVAENGSIYVVLEDPPSVVTLRIEAFDAPSRKATWKCEGWPAKHMPVSCRVS